VVQHTCSFDTIKVNIYRWQTQVTALLAFFGGGAYDLAFWLNVMNLHYFGTGFTIKRYQQKQISKQWSACISEQDFLNLFSFIYILSSDLYYLCIPYTSYYNTRGPELLLLPLEAKSSDDTLWVPRLDRARHLLVSTFFFKLDVLSNHLFAFRVKPITLRHLTTHRRCHHFEALSKHKYTNFLNLLKVR